MVLKKRELEGILQFGLSALMPGDRPRTPHRLEKLCVSLGTAEGMNREDLGGLVHPSPQRAKPGSMSNFEHREQVSFAKIDTFVSQVSPPESISTY